MPASLHDWINRINSRPLPAMAFTVQSVSALMARPNTTHADYQRIVARDPGFALSIFRHLGSLPRPPREPITSLAHAVGLSGTAPLEAGIQKLPVIKAAANEDGKRGLLACYSRAAHAAMYLYQWGEIRKDPNPEELMLAALLHDCAEMALWSEAPDQMATFELRIERGLSRDNAALAVFGFSLTQLGLGLAETWKLPALIGESMAADGAFRARPLGVMLACELALCTATNWDSEQTMDLIELVADYCRQTPDLAAASIHSLSAESARQLQGLDLPVPATALLQLQTETGKVPQGTVEQVKFTADSVTRSTPDPESPQLPVSPPAARLTTRKPPIAKEAQTDAKSLPEPDKMAHPQQNTDTDPPSIGPTPEVENRDPPPVVRLSGTPLQVELTRTMKQLRDNAGLERTMFAMLTPDRKMLRARFIIGAEKDAAIKTFQVSLEKQHLFTLLMSKPQSFWLNAVNRKKYLPAIPQHLHMTLNNNGFFVSSLFVEDKPVGILYADANSTTKLNNGSFTFFKQLVLQLGTALSGDQKARAVG